MGAALSAGALAAQPVRVTVDLSFGKMMQPREHKSLAHQLVRAYGLNRKAPKPLALHFSALALAEAEAPAMLPADGKWRSWPDLERVAAPANEQWPAERLVWLSPDAEAPLLGSRSRRDLRRRRPRRPLGGAARDDGPRQGVRRDRGAAAAARFAAERRAHRS